MKTIWLVWACGLFGAVNVIASTIYLISTRKFDGKSNQIQIFIKNKNQFSPGGLNRFQLIVWRIVLVSKWIIFGFGFSFLFI